MHAIQLSSKLQARLAITSEQLAEFCQRWQVAELALFGSILRDDFDADSDIDMLITFALGSRISLVDLVNMEYELGEYCHRKVDLLTKRSVIESPNWIRRTSILNSCKVIYESRSSLLA
jgi:uncharacterized protein